MPTNNNVKKHYYHSVDLNYGGTDRIRNAFGGSYYVEPASVNLFPEFIPNSQGQDSTDPRATSPQNLTKIDLIYIKEREKQKSVNDELVFPNTRTPILFVGSADQIVDDLEWNKINIGGNYSSSSYEGFKTNRSFIASVWNIWQPYERLEAKEISEDFPASSTTITTEMKSVYQTYLADSEEKPGTIYEMPNLYLLHLLPLNLNNYPNVYDSIAGDLKTFVSLEGKYDLAKLEKLADQENYSWPPAQTLSVPPMPSSAPSGYYPDQKHNLNDYYREWAATQFSENTSKFVNNKMKNLIFDKDVLADNADLAYLSPYYASITIPSALLEEDEIENAGIRAAIEATGFDNIFLHSIKKKFVDGAASTQVFDGHIEASEDIIVEGKEFKFIDISEILLEELNNPSIDKEDFMLLSKDNIERKMLSDTVGNYRYLRTSIAAEFLQSLKILLEPGAGSPDSGMTATQFPFPRIADSSEGNWDLSTFLNLPDKSPAVNNVAFRIEKKGKGATEDGTVSDSVLQNFLFMPTEDSVTFRDSQVKYGETYEYNLYAYRAVVSYKYRYVDLKVSKQIGQADLDDDGDPDSYCLGFYDPVTDSPSPLEWLKTSIGSNNLLAGLESEFGTRSQATSKNQYMSEIVLEIEPCIRIYEVPLNSKEITILDNPPRQVDASPFQRKDNSQVIGFYSRKDSFIEKLYPALLNSNENELREKYLASNNLLNVDRLPDASVSAERYLQIFRLSHRPNSVQDFNNALVAEKDLKIERRVYPSMEDENFRPTMQVSSICFYEEKIQTNKTYYYILRFLNEHRIPGEPSAVIAMRLVDDGGYKFLETDTMTPSELSVGSLYENPSIVGKKLLQVLPNINQINLNTENADFSKTAHSQIENVEVGTSDDRIWDKSFKIRLTSKKTGKKIDLNVTFNLKQMAETTAPQTSLGNASDASEEISSGGSSAPDPEEEVASEGSENQPPGGNDSNEPEDFRDPAPNDPFNLNNSPEEPGQTSAPGTNGFFNIPLTE